MTTDTVYRDRLYLRVSTQKQADKGTPIDTQRGRAVELSSQTGGTVTGEYVELARSGSLPPNRRPEIKLALDDARLGEYDRLLIYDPDRMSRDLDYTGWFRVEFGAVGVQVLDVLTYGQGRTARNMRAFIADEEHQKYKQRAIDSANRVFARCGKYGGKNLFGYRWIDKQTRAIEPTEAAVVRAIYDDFLNGQAIVNLARRHGFHRSYVWRILRHPGYTGAYTYNTAASRPRSEWRVTWDQFDAIVDRETWEHVQTILNLRVPRWDKPTPGQASLPLSGLLSCHQCGDWLRVVRTGKRGRRYRCREAHVTMLDTGWAEAVFTATVKRLRQPSIAQEIANAVNSASRAGPDLSALEAESRRAEQQVDTLIGIIRTGRVQNVTRLAKELDRAQEAARAAQDRLRRANGRGRVLVTRQAVERRLDDLLENPLPSRQFLHSVLERVMVLDRKTGQAFIRTPVSLSSGPREERPWTLPPVAVRVA